MPNAGNAPSQRVDSLSLGADSLESVQTADAFASTLRQSDAVQPSIKALGICCWNCWGFGHPKSECPSPLANRNVSQVMAALDAIKTRKEAFNAARPRPGGAYKGPRSTKKGGNSFLVSIDEAGNITDDYGTLLVEAAVNAPPVSTDAQLPLSADELPQECDSNSLLSDAKADDTLPQSAESTLPNISFDFNSTVDGFSADADFEPDEDMPNNFGPSFFELHRKNLAGGAACIGIALIGTLLMIGKSRSAIRTLTLGAMLGSTSAFIPGRPILGPRRVLGSTASTYVLPNSFDSMLNGVHDDGGIVDSGTTLTASGRKGLPS